MHASPSTAPPRSSFEALYRRHFDFVLTNLRRLGVTPSQLEDAAQDVFVVAYRRWDDFEGRSTERTWLFGITRRIAHRYRRTRDRSTRRRQRLARAATEEGEDVEGQVERQRAGELLHVFLDTLPPDQRDAFILGELEQLGRQEVGAALGISPNTAYSRIRLARERLNRTFDDSQRRYELIMRWRQPPRSSPERRQRVLSLVMLRLGELGSAVAGASVSAWVVAGVVTVVTVGFMALVRPEPPEAAAKARDAQAEPRSVSTPSPQVAEAEPAPTESSDEPPSPVVATRSKPSPTAESPPDPRRSAPVVVDDAPSDEATASDLSADLAGLQRVTQALAAGDPDAALRALAQHEKRFRQTAFVLDRRVLRIETLCAAGRAEQGRAERRQFLREHRQSPQAARARTICTEE